MVQTYSISELSEQFDITARTIRFYEDQGLISPRREGTRRIYEERDRVRMKLILRAKRLGFTLSEIRETLDLYDSASGGELAQGKFVLEVINHHRAILMQQQNDILDVLQDMKNVEQRILNRMKSPEQKAQ
ncbi:MAG: MerR family DNA-binding transcriptional regulator [Arenicellales bacterium]